MDKLARNLTSAAYLRSVSESLPALVWASVRQAAGGQARRGYEFVEPEMRSRLIFAGQVAIVATCALMVGVKVAEEVRMIAGGCDG